MRWSLSVPDGRGVGRIGAGGRCKCRGKHNQSENRPGPMRAARRGVGNQLMVEDGSLRVLSHPVARLGRDRRRRGDAACHRQTTPTAPRPTISASSTPRRRELFVRGDAGSAPCLADGPRAEERALESYGRNLGVAFQLVDDVLDYSASRVELGKAVGDDFREGKITLPIVLALPRAATSASASSGAARFERLDQERGRSRTRDRVARAHGTLAATLTRATDYAGEARRALAASAPRPSSRRSTS